MNATLLLLDGPVAAPSLDFTAGADPDAGHHERASGDDGTSSAPGISRQLRWRRQRKELGLCVQCSKPSPEGTVLCPECSIKHRLKQRKVKGYRSREESGRGRKWKYR